MVPVQLLEGTGEEAKPDATVKLEVKEPNGVSEEVGNTAGLTCADNCLDNALPSDSMLERKEAGDVPDCEVDILGCEDGGADEPSCGEDPDVTEQSSSFGDTFSGSDEGVRMNSSDAEVDSQHSGEDGCNRVFRKKRLTAHWRNFIRPLMWRCHWIELRMKELQAQALLYDKELKVYAHEKHLHSEMVELDRTASRSTPLTCLSFRKQAMKRGKRKRKEDIADVSSYMSHHNIFSYYENNRPESDGHLIDDCGDQEDDTRDPNYLGANSVWPMLGSKGGDSSLEQILITIESVQSRVLKLKSHLNKVMSRNYTEVSLTHDSFVHGLPSLSGPLSPRFSPRNNGDAMEIGTLNTSPNHMSEYEMEDPVMAGSTVSSYGDAAEVDILESTIGLLSSADAHPDRHENGDLCKDNAEDVLINNQAAEELQDFDVSHAMEKNHGVVKEEVESSEDESTAPKVSVYEVGLPRDRVVMPQQQQPAPKPSYTGKRRGRKPKRKRRGAQTTSSGYLTSAKYQKRRVA